MPTIKPNNKTKIKQVKAVIPGPKIPEVMRTDVFTSNLTKSKHDKVIAVLRAYRKCSTAVAKTQWRLFYENGSFNKYNTDANEDLKPIITNIDRLLACRWQTVATLKSYVRNCANTFASIVMKSTLCERDKHMLCVLNKFEGWFRRGSIIKMSKTEEIIPDKLYVLARHIMKEAMSRHTKPTFHTTSMDLTLYNAELQYPEKVDQNGKITYWIRFSTMEPTKRISIPLISQSKHTVRDGIVSQGCSIITDKRTGQLKFTLVTNIAEACEKSKLSYVPLVDHISLDFGLTNLFTTEDGCMFGQGFMKMLIKSDNKIQSLRMNMLTKGLNPADSKKFNKAVKQRRGYIKTEVNRVLNHIVDLKRPAAIAVERLNFACPDMSPQLNRIIQNCGRFIINKKLRDLSDKFGIKLIEVNPAYTSQTCSKMDCGYVDKRNRKDQAHFKCLACGHELNADVNGARNIGIRRAYPLATKASSTNTSRDQLLKRLVDNYNRKKKIIDECIKRSKANSGDEPIIDPRLTNPYFRDWLDRARMSSN